MELALIDFDHTVTTCDTYARFLRRVATPAQLASARWKVGPWVAGYRLGLVSAARLRERVTRLVFTGREAAPLARQAQVYAGQVLPGLLRPEMMQRIAWHRECGHRLVLVSGSLDLYLRPWCERHGLELLCNRLEEIDGHYTGRYLGGDQGARKVDAIRAHCDLSGFKRIHAYGDSREDRAMLALADEAWYRGRRLRGQERTGRVVAGR
jgi:HAD superfamily hydrolase (TIGR01490 family)